MVYHDASREGVISLLAAGRGTATAPVDHPAKILRHRDDPRNAPAPPWPWEQPDIVTRPPLGSGRSILTLSAATPTPTWSP